MKKQELKQNKNLGNSKCRPNLSEKVMKEVAKKSKLQEKKSKQAVIKKPTTEQDYLQKHMFRDQKIDQKDNRQKCETGTRKTQIKNEQLKNQKKVCLNLQQNCNKQNRDCLNIQNCVQKCQKRQNCQQKLKCQELRCKQNKQKSELTKKKSEQKICLGGMGKKINNKKSENKKVEQKKAAINSKDIRSPKCNKEKQMKLQQDKLITETKQKMKAVFEQLKGLGLKDGLKTEQKYCKQPGCDYKITVIPEQQLARTWKKEQFQQFIDMKNTPNLIVKGVGISRSNEKSDKLQTINERKEKQLRGNKNQLRQNKSMFVQKIEDKTKDNKMTKSMVRSRVKAEQCQKQKKINPQNKCQQKTEKKQEGHKQNQGKAMTRSMVQSRMSNRTKEVDNKTAKTGQKCAQIIKKAEQTNEFQEQNIRNSILCENEQFVFGAVCGNVQKCQQNKNKCQEKSIQKECDKKQCKETKVQQKNTGKKQIKNMKSPKLKQAENKIVQQNKSFRKENQKAGTNGIKSPQNLLKKDVKQHRRNNAAVPLCDASRKFN